MRLSRLLFQTLREVPKEAEVVSHQLMLRASLLRQVASGVYEHLPLGWRVIRKVMAIIREEMDRAGAQEVFLPVLSPRELWEESGRWKEYGKELMRLKDRNEREYVLGPTHEEVITDLVRSTVNSYRKLPVNLYQIQTKFRDEIRPRFGVMRSKEFMMKDAYSFDVDAASSAQSYEAMREAYNRIFSRMGLKYRMVEADSGLIGGSYSHEFMVLAGTGEAEIAVCDACEYAANVEKAEPGFAKAEAMDAAVSAYQALDTPGTKTAEDVARFLKKPLEEVSKILFFQAGGELVGVMLRGDHEINEIKLMKHLGVAELNLAKPETVAERLGVPVGFIGPVGLKPVRLVFDRDLASMKKLVTGGNRMDTHLVNVVPGRDFEVGEIAQLRKAREGDGCPKCGGVLSMIRGIEAGQIFKLGTKYSHSMKATFLDDSGKEREMVMGCYGIGVTRTVAAAIEQNHDEKGIIWPIPIAPYHVIVIVLGSDNSAMEAGERVWRQLETDGVEVLFDDRNETPGVKFKDADLIGIPLQIIIGKTYKNEGMVEIKCRRDGKMAKVKLEEAAAEVKRLISQGESK